MIDQIKTLGNVVQNVVYENATWYNLNGVYYLVENTTNEILITTTNELITFEDYAYILKFRSDNKEEVASFDTIVYHSTIGTSSSMLSYKGISTLLGNTDMHNVICYKDNFIVYKRDGGLSCTLLYFDPVTKAFSEVYTEEEVYRISQNRFVFRRGGVYHIAEIQSYDTEENVLQFVNRPVSSHRIVEENNKLYAIRDGVKQEIIE